MRARTRTQASRGGIALAAAALALAAMWGGTVASASATRVPKSLVGCWHRHAPALPVGTPAGVWLMKLTSSGELLAYTPGTKSCSAEPDFTSTISVVGSHLTIGSLPVCSTTGKYTWKAAGKALTLKATADTCSSRKLLFAAGWKKT